MEGKFRPESLDPLLMAMLGAPKTHRTESGYRHTFEPTAIHKGEDIGELLFTVGGLSSHTLVDPTTGEEVDLLEDVVLPEMHRQQAWWEMVEGFECEAEYRGLMEKLAEGRE